jgi:HPt (histidine-containing phosphotransfer) domain-containing protein
MSEENAIDSRVVERLKHWGGDGLIRDLVGLFRKTTPERIRDIRQGIDGGRADEAERGAHTLKSSSGNLGVTRMYELAARIESEASEGALDGLDGLVDELEREYERARAELEAIEKGLGE